MKTDKDKISYSIGSNIARSLMQIKNEIDLEKLIEGLQDQFNERPLQVTEEESRRLMQMFSTKMKKNRIKKMKDWLKRHLKKGPDS